MFNNNVIVLIARNNPADLGFPLLTADFLLVTLPH